MSVDVGRTIQEGGKRTLARNGLYFVAIVWALGVLNSLLSSSIAREMVGDFPGQGPGPFAPPTVGPSLGVSPAVAGFLSLVAAIVSLIVGAAALRTFVTEETETVPGDHFTHNLGWMVVNLIVGGIVFGIVVAVGLVFLIVPGLFLLVSLFFWNAYVILEDENFVTGFQDSWALTRGKRLTLFVLGVVVVIVVVVVELVFSVPGTLLPGVAGLAVNQIGSAFTTVFVVAAAARAYVQLTAEAEEPADVPDA